MSCYIRHLGEWFELLGLENTKENRKKLDLAIRKEIGTKEEEHCPEVWEKLKIILSSLEEKDKLINSLKKI